jgi:hypothetical protein
MAAGIKAVPGSEAINTIGKNNISSMHLPHWRPNGSRELVNEQNFGSHIGKKLQKY